MSTQLIHDYLTEQRQENLAAFQEIEEKPSVLVELYEQFLAYDFNAYQIKAKQELQQHLQ